MNNTNNIIQVFEKAIYRSYIFETISCLEKLYDRDNGYLVGKVTITPREDGKVNISVPISKKEIIEGKHEEVFVKSCAPNDVSSIIEGLTNTYTRDSGWSIGEREIINIDELSSVVRVELKKAAKGPFLNN